jgi:hypothetical protein
VEKSDVEKSDVEKSDVEKSDVEKSDVEKSDVEDSDVEDSDDESDVEDSDDESDNESETQATLYVVIREILIEYGYGDDELDMSKAIDLLLSVKKSMGEDLAKFEKELEGNFSSYKYYHTVISRVRKTLKLSPIKYDFQLTCPTDEEFLVGYGLKSLKNDKDTESEICSICLSTPDENDFGITPCGHIFCYSCVMFAIDKMGRWCPMCKRKLERGNVLNLVPESSVRDSFDSSKESVPVIEPDSDDEDSDEDKKRKHKHKHKHKHKSKQKKKKKKRDKRQKMIDEYGSKIACLVEYLDEIKGSIVLFSQWDDLLNKVGAILRKQGIIAVFCKGNYARRDKVIRDFNDGDIQVIMLSSTNTASGTNLTKASEIIFLDPVYGEKTLRKQTESQAIGRAHRIGQKKQLIVTRFIVKDTIEEEIYENNRIEDT